MTRFLSEALQAPEPFFRSNLDKLEAANSFPATDISFSSEVNRETMNKLRELGLDPSRTTASELYRQLTQKLAADDVTLTRTLRTLAAKHVSAEADVVAGMIVALKQLPDTRRCYAIKNSSLKNILRSLPPKKALKSLGYRSLDSCLKHEPVVLIMAAAALSENERWHKQLSDHYKKLDPIDFEERAIQIIQPTAKRWQRLASETVNSRKHNLLSFKELGAIVFLPLPADRPPGVVTASLSLALSELNQIRAASSFLKLARMKPDFGKTVVSVTADEPQLKSKLLDKPVPWHLIQRYYARLNEFRADLFEPHLEQADLAWQPIEDALAKIEPALAFWRQTAHLGLVHDHQPVSLNIVDTALSCCNHLPFEQRVVHYFQQSLWHELLLRYLYHEPVENSVMAELQPELATETVPA